MQSNISYCKKEEIMEKTLIDYLEEAADYSLEEKRYLRTVVKAEEYRIR